MAQLKPGSKSLRTLLEAKDSFGVKQTGMALAPAGKPNFLKILDSENTSQISVWNAHFGKEAVAKLIFVIIEDINQYFNVARPMTVPQMADLALEIADSMWAYRMEDLFAFAECMKKGTFAKVYERLDPPLIWEQLGLYEQMRANHLFDEENKHKQSDPRIFDEETEKAAGRITNIAGAMNGIRANLNELKRKEK